MAFASMVIDLADRQVVAAFPALGPVLAGWLSDRCGLTAALAVLPLLCVVFAAMSWYGSRFYERDRAAAPVAAAMAPARPQAGHP